LISLWETNGYSGFSAWPHIVVVVGGLALLDFAITKLDNELKSEVER
jgi:hypothetical protein